VNEIQIVDRLVVDVVIDNLSDSYSSKPAHVSPEFDNVIAAGAAEISGETLCCAQLGLGLVLTATAGLRQYKLMFDAGPEGSIFLRNAAALGITLSDVQAIAISHGHWDHMGALLSVLDQIQAGNGGSSVPCYTNPGMFVERAARLTSGAIGRFQHVPTPALLSQHGAEVVNRDEEALLLDGHFYLSGEIPRVSDFEKGRPDHLCRPHPEAEWQPDPLLMDERFLAVQIRGKGLLIFSSCSHAGVINVLLHARSRFPDVPLYGVLGGLHLSGAAMEPLIPATVEALKQFNLEQIMTAHCTGWRAVSALVQAFGEVAVTPCAVGSRFSF